MINSDWISTLDISKRQELFEGIKNAQKSIDSGVKGKDFDEYF